MKAGYFSEVPDRETLEDNALDLDGAIRWVAAIELGQVQEEWSAQILWRLKTDHDENVRAAALNSLSRFDRAQLAQFVAQLDFEPFIERPETKRQFGDDDYVPWRIRPLPDPSPENEWQVAPALLDIINTESPVTGGRILYLYGSAVFPNMPKKISKYRLKKALNSLIGRNLIARADTVDDENLENWILHTVGMPDVVVRDKGPRTYGQIPINEVRAMIIKRLRSRYESSSPDTKFMTLQEVYSIKNSELHIIGGLLENEWQGLFDH